MSSGLDRTRTLRGAVERRASPLRSGASAAAGQARVPSSGYDDVELLGKAVTRDDGWYPIGFAMHMANGAVFGAVYANLAPPIRLPAPLRGPAAALAEHVACGRWCAITDRAHPARKRAATPVR